MGDERLEIPLFPLGTVLFPGGVLPLKIFELRYQEMTKRCIRDGTPFGVCLIRAGREVGEPAVPVEIGCTARITDWEMPHPNLFHLKALGERRFRVLRTEVAALGLLMGEAQFLPEPAQPIDPDPACRNLLSSLIEQYGADVFPAPVRLDDAAWVAYRLAEVLALAPSARQSLLELDDPVQRQGIVRRVLERVGAKK